MTNRNPYSQRRNVLSKQDKLRFNKWAAQPRRTDDGKIDRIALWDTLHRFVRNREGQIISPPGTYPIRLQVPPDSELPQKLTELGYIVTFKSRDSIIGLPMPKWRDWNTSHSFHTVAVYELDLPKQRYNPTSKAAIPVV